MALVEYSSSSSSDSEGDAIHQNEEQHRPSKRRRTSPPPLPPQSPTTIAPNPSSNPSTLPPLPPSFHDLYASTVRTALADLPSLHHGRTRAIPHKEGNWPSHIYTEWHPPPAQHALLRSLLAALDAALAPELQPPHELSGFLESGLGAPLPLHVSLSRPFVLRTGDKDEFLGELVRAVEGCGMGAFELVCDGLGWHRSPDSNRSFLVLRVRSAAAAAAAGEGVAGRGRNPELSALLARCNDLMSSYGQPRLYAASSSPSQQQQQGNPGGQGKEGGGSQTVGDAFHVSVAWSFAEPTDEIRRRTAEVFARPEFRDGVTGDITIPVEGVKAKIGNVVTNIGLLGRKKGRRGQGLFGEGLT